MQTYNNYINVIYNRFFGIILTYLIFFAKHKLEWNDMVKKKNKLMAKKELFIKNQEANFPKTP